jgi:hypothetical protein
MVSRWLMLVYKIPREPTAGRVYIWRKLKQLGAFALQDAVWVLPQTSRTQEQLQWLAAEITEIGGEAVLLQTEQLYATDANRLRKQFEEPVEAAYREILAALKKKDRDLDEVSKRFQRAQSRDFFGSALGHKVRERLLSIGGGGHE